MHDTSGNSISQGDRVRIHSAGVFTVVDAIYDAARVLETHTHNDALLSFAPRGAYDETVDGKRHACVPGAYLLKPAGIQHANHFSSRRTRCISIVIPESAAESFGALRQLLETPRLVSGAAVMFQLVILTELRKNDDLASLALQGVVSDTLAAISRHDARSTSIAFDRARDFIHSNLSGGLRIEDIAAAADVHAGHLNRLFRQHAGASTAEYVRRVRIERAAHDLVRTRLAISEVAAKHGFYDQSHLTNAFRCYVGCSPATYRRQWRG